MENGCRKYLSQLKSYPRGENTEKVAIHINNNCQYTRYRTWYSDIRDIEVSNKWTNIEKANALPINSYHNELMIES